MATIGSSFPKISETENAIGQLQSALADKKDDSKLKSTFQDVVAGTFYKEMMKSLQKMHDKPAYFFGGQAEKIFQGQLDQQVAENLAHGRGNDFADSLYKAFTQRG